MSNRAPQLNFSHPEASDTPIVPANPGENLDPVFMSPQEGAAFLAQQAAAEAAAVRPARRQNEDIADVVKVDDAGFAHRPAKSGNRPGEDRPGHRRRAGTFMTDHEIEQVRLHHKQINEGLAHRDEPGFNWFATSAERGTSEGRHAAPASADETAGGRHRTPYEGRHRRAEGAAAAAPESAYEAAQRALQARIDALDAALRKLQEDREEAAAKSSIDNPDLHIVDPSITGTHLVRANLAPVHATGSEQDDDRLARIRAMKEEIRRKRAADAAAAAALARLAPAPPAKDDTVPPAGVPRGRWDSLSPEKRAALAANVELARGGNATPPARRGRGRQALHNVLHAPTYVGAKFANRRAAAAGRTPEEQRKRRNRLMGAAAGVLGAAAAGVGVYLATRHSGVEIPIGPEVVTQPAKKGKELVDGFNPNVKIAKGEGVEQAVGDLLHQKGLPRDTKLEESIYQDITHRFKGIFTNDPLYRRKQGDLGISRPGSTRWKDAVIHRINKMAEAWQARQQRKAK